MRIWELKLHIQVSTALVPTIGSNTNKSILKGCIKCKSIISPTSPSEKSMFLLQGRDFMLCFFSSYFFPQHFSLIRNLFRPRRLGLFFYSISPTLHRTISICKIYTPDFIWTLNNVRQEHVHFLTVLRILQLTLITYLLCYFLLFGLRWGRGRLLLHGIRNRRLRLKITESKK